MGELDQEQELRERVVLAVDVAFVQPALGDRQQLREEPCLDLAIELVDGGLLGPVSPSWRKYFSSVSLASRKATSLSRRLLRSSSVWMLLSPTIGAFSVLVGMSAVVRVSCESSVNLAVSCFVGQLVAVAEQAREGDLAGDAALEGADAGGHRAGLGVRDRAGAGDERERHAVDLGVFGLETPVGVGGVAHAAQGAADDLLAEKLRAEGADAEDMGDGVGVPALGEHRDADDALDVFAELAGLADGVHDFAEQVFVGQARRRRGRGSGRGIRP